MQKLEQLIVPLVLLSVFAIRGQLCWTKKIRGEKFMNEATWTVHELITKLILDFAWGPLDL